MANSLLFSQLVLFTELNAMHSKQFNNGTRLIFTGERFSFQNAEANNVVGE
jgi:hypothetical protein